MTNKKIDSVLNKIVDKIEPEKKKVEFMEKVLNSFLEKTNKRIARLGIDAELFVGGSFAKKTLIRKRSYDVDLFLRFNKKYPNDKLVKLTKKILRWQRGVSVIHGSRDYFNVKINSWFYLEIIPVKKVSNTKDAENITDLSYSHVKYIKSKVKKEKVLEGIKIAKAFCYANKTYGAESYVHGFSGYSLELLVYYYGSFEKFLRELVKVKKDKLIIDIEKDYKNKKSILLDMNSSKLDSPIVLVDPTFKARNVIAALSSETFEKFRDSAKAFLKNPSKDFFEVEEVDYGQIKKEAKGEFILLQTKTKRQEGDIAGTKLLKFFRHLEFEFSKYFEILDSGFEYEGKKKGINYFVLKPKKEFIFVGPLVEDVRNIPKFKAERENVFIKKGRLFSRMKIDFSGREFLNKWMKKNRRKIKEMYVCGLNVVS